MLSKRIRILLLCVVMVLMLLPVQALAARAIDTQKETSLSVHVVPDGVPQKGVELRLYQVAVVSKNCLFTLTGEFEHYPVSLNDNDSDSWREVATTLEGYARTDKLEPTRVVKTDENGTAAFTGLSTGLYLVIGNRWYVNSYQYYTPSPILISLPTLDAQDSWVYDVTVNAKLVPGWDDSTPDYTDISVLKVWDDGGSEQRPAGIVVELYDDDKLEDTVTLSKANNWQHTWTQLEEDGIWIVREKEVPEGYTVSVEKQGTRFVLTNTLPDEPPPDEPPPDEPTPPPDEPTPPPDEPDTPPDEPTLPQTGVLWWPVPVLLAAGLALILLGVLRKRTAYED